MRLKPEKVVDLTRQVTKALEGDSRATLLKPADDVERAVREVFLADLRREDDLMEEVEKVIEEHRGKITGKNVDMQVLRRKIRDQLARERRLVLGRGSNMRLSDDRIQSISDQIARHLRENKLVRYQGLQIRLVTAIGRVITNDLKIEAQINAEVEEMIEKMQRDIPRGSAEWNAIFFQKKEELARRRNYVF